MWRYGCPRSPDWGRDSDGETDDETDVKEWNEYDMWNVRYVLEGPLWASVRAFLVADVREGGQLRLSHLTPATPSAGRGVGSDLAILGANPRRE